MERKKYLLIAISLTTIVFFSSIISFGSNSYNISTFKERIYVSYINGDMVTWEKIVKEMEGIPSLTSQKELLGYYYGLTGYLISVKEKKKAAVYVTKGDVIIDRILAKTPQDALFTAYKAAFLGFKIGLNNLKAMTLGMKSADLSKVAFLKDSLNAQVVTERANVLYYSPSFVGGNKTEAMRLYKRAISLIEQSNDIAGNWFYLSLLTNIARLEEELGNYKEALSLYKKILTIEPQYKWVKNELYPALKSRF